MIHLVLLPNRARRREWSWPLAWLLPNQRQQAHMIAEVASRFVSACTGDRDVQYRDDTPPAYCCCAWTLLVLRILFHGLQAASRACLPSKRAFTYATVRGCHTPMVTSVLWDRVREPSLITTAVNDWVCYMAVSSTWKQEKMQDLCHIIWHMRTGSRHAPRSLVGCQDGSVHWS